MENIYEKINGKIETLLNGQLEGFQKTWISIKVEPFARNPHTNHYYSMINNLLLNLGLMTKHGYYLNRWITFLQANDLKARVKKGSTANPIVFTSHLYLNADGKNVTKIAEAILNAGNKIPGDWKKLPFLKGYYVFNVGDVEGLPEDWLRPENTTITPAQRITKVEDLIFQTGAAINETTTNQPCYYPGKDCINVPKRWQFENPNQFYAVLFHELGHWTGHPSRLNRTLSNKQEDYAFEELVAELTAAYCCARLNLDGQITNNAAYIKSWLQGLQNDMKFFTIAASLAQKAVDFIFVNEATEERRAAA